MSSAKIQPMQLNQGLAEWFPPIWSLRPSSGDPLHVLVAEPRPAVRRQIGRALRRAGMHAEFASNAGQALELLETRAFDVVVVDPKMDAWRGLEVCRSAAQGRVADRTPVITLAGSHSWLCALRSRLAGARMQFSRPVSLDRFVSGVWSIGSCWQRATSVVSEAA